MRRMGSAGLGYGQIFFVLFGFLVASALIFLFGIWVGRDLTERRLAQEERVVRLPVPAQPTPSDEERDLEMDRAFYEKLKEKALQRMQETAAAVPPTAAPVVQRPTPTRAPARVAAKPTPPPPGAARPRATAVARGEEWADAGWTVQVNATTDPRQANELARSLRAKGYDAYTVQAPLRGQTWYRVRVGRFSDREQAKQLESRLRRSEGMDNAYVTAR